MTANFEEYKTKKQNRAASESTLELPHSQEAEEGFIFTFMHRPLDMFEALSKVDSPDYFYLTAPGLAYTGLKLALDDLDDVSNDMSTFEINPIALKGYLEGMGKLGDGENQVSLDYLLRLYGSDTYNPANLKKYVRKLANFAARRKLFISTEQVRQSLIDQSVRIEDITRQQLESAYTAEFLADLEGKRSEFKPYSTDVLGLEALDFAAMERRRLEKPLPVTNISKIDGNFDQDIFPFFTFGYSSLVTILGQTGGGKSSFIHQIVLESAKRGMNVFFANTENNPENIRLRNIAYYTKIPFQRIEFYFGGFESMLSKGEVEQIKAVDLALRGQDTDYRGQQYKGLKIDFYDASFKTSDQLVTEALKRHNLAQRSESYGHKGYGLFVLDHIQDLARPASMRKNDNDSDRHVEAMKRLKDLAYQTNTPVLVASHITESLCEKTDDGMYRPTLYSSKGSREMALKAQLVVGLTFNAGRTACELEILKRNNGSVGDILTVGYLPGSYRFF